MTYGLTISSDYTKKHTLQIETDSTDILELAAKYGTTEAGGIVELTNGKELIARAGWDGQYRKYRQQAKDGEWI
jgi:hypothetical protein